MPTSITLQELQKLQQQNAGEHHLIDLRTTHEYAQGHAIGAKNLPYDLLMTYPDAYLNRKNTYYLICEYGFVSHRACVILQTHGYHVVSINGGYQANQRCPYY